MERAFFCIMKKRVDCKDMLRTNPVISILVIVSAAKDQNNRRIVITAPTYGQISSARPNDMQDCFI